MVNYEEINEFIADNVLHSTAWDNATEEQRKKAINQASRTLLRYFSNRYIDKEIPTEHLAEESLWLLRIDDMVQRTEMGAKYINIDGISVAYSHKDRTLSPFIMEAFGLSEGWNLRRKVGRYSTSLRDSYRKGW